MIDGGRDNIVGLGLACGNGSSFLIVCMMLDISFISVALLAMTIGDSAGGVRVDIGSIFTTSASSWWLKDSMSLVSEIVWNVWRTFGAGITALVTVADGVVFDAFNVVAIADVTVINVVIGFSVLAIIISGLAETTANAVDVDVDVVVDVRLCTVAVVAAASTFLSSLSASPASGFEMNEVSRNI